MQVNDASMEVPGVLIPLQPVDRSVIERLDPPPQIIQIPDPILATGLTPNLDHQNVGSAAKVPGITRRVRDPDNWKRNRAKKALYSSKRAPQLPTCSHMDKSKTFKCGMLDEEDVKNFHKMFYRNRSKLEQDTFILLYSYSNLVQRKRPKDNSRNCRTVSTTYHVRKTNNKVVQVCKSAFENILCVSKSRVSNVVKRHFLSGELPRETRGGNRQPEKYDALRSNVRSFIDKFPVTTTLNDKGHQKHVLSADMNVQKLLKIYNDQSPENLKVKKDFFYKIFNTEYNISFASFKDNQQSLLAERSVSE